MINKDIDLNELKELVSQKDRGYVKIYYKYFHNIIKCTSITPSIFYMHDCNTNSLIKKDIAQIQNHFMDNMKILMKHLFNHYRIDFENKVMCQMGPEKEFEIKNFIKKIESIQNIPEFNKVSKCKILMKSICAEFYDDDFAKEVTEDNPKYIINV